jgi:HD-like signal output (HDOD) protein
MLNESVIKKIESRVQDMPTLPVIAAKILEVLDDPDSSASDLKKVISLDSVLTARLLRMVNSAFYGFPRRIDSLTNAIVILGFNNVRSLALSVSILDFFENAAARSKRLDYTALWKHSVGVAFCSRLLARKTMPDFTEQGFVAGLLHDIGIIVVDNCFRDQFTLCLAATSAERRPLQEIEKEIMGFTHAEIGQYAAEKWLLPQNLVEAIGYHHNPAKATSNFELTAIVHVADVICKTRKFGNYGDNEAVKLSQIDEGAGKALRLVYPLSTALEEDIDKELARAEDFLKIFN